MLGSYEHHDKTLVSLKSWEFLGQLHDSVMKFS
jgi:hypothetical protein